MTCDLLRRGGALVLLFAFLIASRAQVSHAQELRGTVRDSASGGAIPGAVLLLRNASGATIARNITNERGQYRLAGIDVVQSIQVLRIGFRPRVVTLTDAARASGLLDVVMVRIPQLLDVVEVNDQPACPRRPDRPKAFALWQQARAALLATVVAREANPAVARILEFQQTMDPRRDTIVSQTVHLASGRTTRPFVSAKSARQFIEAGFETTDSSGRTFYGPDADVMLDEAFAEGYCFQLENGPTDHPNEIGLGFKPAHHEGDHIDVEGTLWIDSVARSLTRLDFRYLGVSNRERDLGAGGLVSFRMMPSGVPLIDRWYLRLISFHDPIGPPTRNSVSLAEPQLAGAEIADVRWDSGLEWHDALGTLRGTVYASDHPVSHAAIRLSGTDYRATTDSLGTFEISDLLPGPYQISIDDPVLDSLGLELTYEQRFRAARDSVLALRVTMPTIREMVAKRCANVRRSDDDNLIAGRASNPDGTPAANARLLLRLVGSIHDAPFGGVKPVDVRWALGADAETIIDAKTGADGRFLLCHVPQDSKLLLIIQSPTAADAEEIETPESTRLVPVWPRLQPIAP